MRDQSAQLTEHTAVDTQNLNPYISRRYQSAHLTDHTAVDTKHLNPNLSRRYQSDNNAHNTLLAVGIVIVNDNTQPTLES